MLDFAYGSAYKIEIMTFHRALTLSLLGRLLLGKAGEV